MNPSPNALEYPCSICGEKARRICKWCTKDACENHLCPQCGRCSDCCDCEFSREAEAPASVSSS